MTSNQTPVILLTGASSGLGLAIARELINTPVRVILTARSESLDRFSRVGIQESPRVHLRPLDVTNPAERESLIQYVTHRWGPLTGLINNAGVAYRTVVEHWDEKAWQHTMDVDVWSVLALSRLVLPGMRQVSTGRILNISSVGGMMAMPTMSLYSAAKFALEGATEALWYEVRPWNIRVSLIEPGFICSDSFRNTRFTQRSFAAAMNESDPYHRHYLTMAHFIERMMRGTIATPERVAKGVVRTLFRRNPPLRVYATPDAHLFAMLRRLLPRTVYHWALYRALPDVATWGKPPKIPSA
jgi:NADP-dependent 3-hydroxy acid dehydrogenase YdfG